MGYNYKGSTPEIIEFLRLKNLSDRKSIEPVSKAKSTLKSKPISELPPIPMTEERRNELMYKKHVRSIERKQTTWEVNKRNYKGNYYIN